MQMASRKAEGDLARATAELSAAKAEEATLRQQLAVRACCAVLLGVACVHACCACLLCVVIGCGLHACLLCGSICVFCDVIGCGLRACLLVVYYMRPQRVLWACLARGGCFVLLSAPVYAHAYLSAYVLVTIHFPAHVHISVPALPQLVSALPVGQFGISTTVVSWLRIAPLDHNGDRPPNCSAAGGMQDGKAKLHKTLADIKVAKETKGKVCLLERAHTPDPREQNDIRCDPCSSSDPSLLSLFTPPPSPPTLPRPQLSLNPCSSWPPTLPSH